MQQFLVYAIFGFFLFLILNWIINTSTTPNKLMEGVENKDNKNDKDDSKPSIKCPEDCSAVKETQKKLSDALKTVQLLEQKIEMNTQASAAHSNSISEMNKSLDEMQKKDE